MINPKIFKSNDVRGIYPSDLNEESAFKIGQAIVFYAKAKKIVIGRDMRISSDSLFGAITNGIISAGVDVIDIGLVPTEGMYFALDNYDDYGAGIMITASHNPASYNGFKVLKKGSPTSEFIRGDIIANYIRNEDIKAETKGNIETLDIWDDYINHSFSFVDVKKIKPLKIVIDAGNGMAGKVMSKIKNKLPIEIIPLNFELDGNFPAHPSNPLLEGSTDQVIAAVKKHQADFGFIFDGDMDRMFPIDEKGNLVRGDKTLLIIAQYLLAKNPGAGVAYNLICSKSVPEFITKWGGVPIRTPVGFVSVRQGIVEQDGLFGGELSGHFSFKDNFYNDSGLISFLMILELLSGSNKKLSEIVSEFSIYFKHPELNFTVEDKEKMIDIFRKKYSDGKQDDLDGLTVQYSDWWFNIRSSNTEPLLRLTIEGDTQEILDKKIEELTALLKSNL